MSDLKDVPREEGRKDGRGWVVIRASLRKEMLESARSLAGECSGRINKRFRSPGSKT